MYTHKISFLYACLLLSTSANANDPQKIPYPNQLPVYQVMALTKSKLFLGETQCYATKMDFTDNVSSALPTGLICYETSTGFYVYDGKSITTLAGLGHPIRFKENIYSYRDKDSVITNSWLGDIRLNVESYSKVASKDFFPYQIKASCDTDTQMRQEKIVADMSDKNLIFKGEVVDISRDKSTGKPIATVSISLEDPKFNLPSEKFKSTLILNTYIEDNPTAFELEKDDKVEVIGKVLSIEKGSALDNYNCFVSFSSQKVSKI